MPSAGYFVLAERFSGEIVPKRAVHEVQNCAAFRAGCKQGGPHVVVRITAAERAKLLAARSVRDRHPLWYPCTRCKGMI